MARLSNLQRGGLRNGYGHGLVLFLLATVAVAVPTANSDDTTLDVAAPQLLPRTNWEFSCYATGETCAENSIIGNTGATRVGSNKVASCRPVDHRGCDRYSYSGVGQFKLCLYSNADCQGTAEGPNGGTVRCLHKNSRSYKVVASNANC